MGHIGSMTEFGFGWLTPVLSYVMACIGAGLGLRCMVRALGTTGRTRRSWLINGAIAIGAGIWTMHFIAMLGFTVTGTDIRYDVPLTVLSLVVAILVVGVGVFTVSYSRSKLPAVLGGGVITGLGVAAMHYIGMAAMRLSGMINYNPLVVGLSVLIAVLAATAALWATLTVQGSLAAFGASLVMGAAVSLMHYTGMAAVHVDLHAGAHAMHSDLSGATPMWFILPLTVLLGTYLFLSSAFVAISPNVPTLNSRRKNVPSTGTTATEDQHQLPG